MQPAAASPSREPINARLAGDAVWLEASRLFGNRHGMRPKKSWLYGYSSRISGVIGCSFSANRPRPPGSVNSSSRSIARHSPSLRLAAS